MAIDPSPPSRTRSARRLVGALGVAALGVVALRALLAPDPEVATARGPRADRAGPVVEGTGLAAPDAPALPPGARPAAAPGAPVVDASGDAGAAPAPRELTADEIRARLAAGEPGMEVLASRLPETGQPVPLAPRWAEGDEWVVETWYLQQQACDATWTGPSLWRFRVEREVPLGGEPCWELVVTRADEPLAPPVVVWVARATGRLQGVEATVAQQGKPTRTLWRPDAGAGAHADDAALALRAPVTSAPIRLPGPGAIARTAPAGLPFDPTPGGGDLPPDAPAPSSLVGAGGGYLDLELTDPFDGTRVRQRWAPGDLRWPVVSRTETTVSFRRG